MVKRKSISDSEDRTFQDVDNRSISVEEHLASDTAVNVTVIPPESNLQKDQLSSNSKKKNSRIANSPLTQKKSTCKPQFKRPKEYQVEKEA